MKRIIEKGDEVFSARCKQCGCLFEYTLNELLYLGSLVTCPTCNHFVSHRSKKIRENEIWKDESK